jgi:CRISPR/Cas system-associated exonuclease Cas4 (RecB family)
MWATLLDWISRTTSELAQLDVDLIILVLLGVITLVILGRVGTVLESKEREVGVSTSTITVSVDGTKTLPVRNYVSEIQGLAGKPDALISEDGFIIPIERKPLARKVRDRYVAQLLVYMRLVEEFEGKKPPYGYLILGPNCRRFKIENSPARQAWLQKHLDEMRAILAGGPSQPTPHPRKCRKCDVRHACAHRAEENTPIQIGQRPKERPLRVAAK